MPAHSVAPQPAPDNAGPESRVRTAAEIRARLECRRAAYRDSLARFARIKERIRAMVEPRPDVFAEAVRSLRIADEEHLLACRAIAELEWVLKEETMKKPKPRAQAFLGVYKVRRDRQGLARCRVCGCTQLDACANGCGWSETPDLCTTCAAPVDAIREWCDNARRPNVTGLLREVRRQIAAELVQPKARSARAGRGAL